MSEKGKGKKRSKAYYLKCAHKKVRHGHSLDTNMKGFLVTCNGNEKQAVREMYNLLNEYADKLYGPEEVSSTTPAATKEETVSDESDNGDDEEDIETAMKKEVTAMKEVVKQKDRRFQNTNTKSRNTIFIKTTLDDPSTLAHSILSDIYANGTQKSRFAIRMLPIEATCKCRLDDIEACVKIYFKKYFETPFGTGLSYTTIFTRRNNTEISREFVIPKLGHVIKDLNPLHTVNHTTPDYVILVEVIGNNCCIGVVKDFFKFKKYNLIEVSKAKSSQEKEKPVTEDGELKVVENADTCETAETVTLENNDRPDEQPVAKKRKRESSSSEGPEEALDLSVQTDVVPSLKSSLSRDKTVIMKSLTKGDNTGTTNYHLEKNETVVMESLDRSETVVMQTLDRVESTMDALSKGESVMDMVIKPDESVMEVLTTGESVMESSSNFSERRK